jgi:hypothetical protein
VSTKIFTSTDNHLVVTSYCGPVDTNEQTRARLQIDIYVDTSIGLRDAIGLRAALDQWIAEVNKPGIPYTIAEVETVLRTHAMDPYHRELMQWLVGQLPPKKQSP